MGTVGLAVSSVARDAVEPASRLVAVRAIQAFTGDLFNRLAARPGNLVCSPYSVAVALAMTRNGAQGQTADELDRVLHAPALDHLNSGLNSLRAGPVGRSEPTGRRRRSPWMWPTRFGVNATPGGNKLSWTSLPVTTVPASTLWTTSAPPKSRVR